MDKRKFGNSGLGVSTLGLGCMGMSEFYGGRDIAESLRVFQRALELGINFFDTADIYGPWTNEVLVGEALREHRDEVILCTKFGIVRDASGGRLGISGKPEYVHACCDASLKRLGVDQIDIYYQHRVDPEVPIEETVGAMAELVTAGKVRFLGLSEADSATIERAHAVHPIAALQTEYSLWSREPEAELLDCTRRLGIAFVAYSPLGRGFLTGSIQSIEDLDGNDWRRTNPRFQEENLVKNRPIAAAIAAIAHGKGVTPAQLALAWVLAQDDHIFPIPGTKRLAYLEQNVQACDIELTIEELELLDAAAPPGRTAGERY